MTALAVWAVLAGAAARGAAARGAEVREVLPVHERLVMVHLSEGHVVHHVAGQARHEETVVISPLDVAAAGRVDAWRVTSTDDAAFGSGLTPARVGRKSKGSDFAWYAEDWKDGRALNLRRPDHVKEHWIYLELSEPMSAGKTYRVDAPGLPGLTFGVGAGAPGERRDRAAEGAPLDAARFGFGSPATRSEAVHVNLLGYVPSAPRKLGYVFHWAGDFGGIDFAAWEGRAFRVVGAATGATVFEGKIVFRARMDAAETGHPSDSPPHGNFLGAPVWECDFSALNTPGEYRLVVEGIGASFPFRVGDDVIKPAARATLRALYHNRSGIALTEPYTRFTRPAPHHVRLTPGFAGRLIYTTVRVQEWGSEGGDKAALLAGSKGALSDTWGWYQDAGDWDSYASHLRVPQELLLAWELARSNFKDGDAGIPESGNGVPDVLDEAAWLARFCHRLRHELLAKGWGTGGIGLRVAGDAFGPDEKVLPGGKRVGQGSWEDVGRTWAVSGEDPVSTYGYAGVAAQLASALAVVGVKDPEGVDWAREAREAYAWAAANTRASDKGVGPHRAYAAAALFRLTGEKAYEAQLATDTAGLTGQAWDEHRFGPWLYVLNASTNADPALLARLRGVALATADASLQTSERRALRWAGNWHMPMLVGQQTTPWATELAVGYRVARSTDPARAGKYLAALHTTADHFLGTNSLNTVWMTGVGPRHVTEIFHMDAWYNGGPGNPSNGYPEGLIPYSPWRKEKDLGNGPWDVAWAHKTLYPPIDAWPGGERWFPNRCSPMGAEFTVHQNTAPAAAFYGLLTGDGLTR